MSRLREGRANTVRGAAHFLRETVGRVRYGGASGQLTVRADRGFYTHAVVSACREMDVRYSITVRQHQSLRNLTEAIPEADWTPIAYWMDGAADVAETSYTPFESKPGAAPVRFIVPASPSAGGCSPRPVPNWPSSPATATTAASPTGRGKPWHWRPTTAATPRSRTPSATSSTAWGSTISPRGCFPANGAWLAVQVMAHNLSRWTARIGLGEPVVTTKTLRRRFFSIAGRLTRSARRLTLHLPKRWPWETQFSGALARLRARPFPA